MGRWFIGARDQSGRVVIADEVEALDFDDARAALTVRMMQEREVHGELVPTAVNEQLRQVGSLKAEVGSAFSLFYFLTPTFPKLALCVLAKCAIWVAALFLLGLLIIFLCGWSLYNDSARESQELYER